MKHILFISLLLFPFALFAQIENVIVETYYISDANDSTDTDGGKLEQGSKTYRIYIDLKQGYKIRKIYGDANHALLIKSTADFFNNMDRPATFGYKVNKSWLSSNTVALDSWLTLGRATSGLAGVLKSEDTDGSFVGGMNNDGGSAAIPEGLLSNADPDAGIRLVVADGLMPDTAVLSTWLDDGFRDASGDDTTIFGSVVTGSEFISNHAFLQQNSGVSGVTPGNKVLVAQLTTKGDISFELNVEIMDPAGKSVYYVAAGHDSDYINLSGVIIKRERLSPFLKYPPECGCKDPKYREYSKSYACNDSAACKTPVVYGCLDTMACNYDPKTNFHISSLCCYPGYCNDRDLGVVCPAVAFYRPAFTVYPNPAQNQISVKWENFGTVASPCIIYNSYGIEVMEQNIEINSQSGTKQINISNLHPGLYMIRLFNGTDWESKNFMKN